MDESDQVGELWIETCHCIADLGSRIGSCVSVRFDEKPKTVRESPPAPLGAVRICEDVPGRDEQPHASGLRCVGDFR